VCYTASHTTFLLL